MSWNRFSLSAWWATRHRTRWEVSLGRFDVSGVAVDRHDRELQSGGVGQMEQLCRGSGFLLEPLALLGGQLVGGSLRLSLPAGSVGKGQPT